MMIEIFSDGLVVVAKNRINIGIESWFLACYNCSNLWTAQVRVLTTGWLHLPSWTKGHIQHQTEARNGVHPSFQRRTLQKLPMAGKDREFDFPCETLKVQDWRRWRFGGNGSGIILIFGDVVAEVGEWTAGYGRRPLIHHCGWFDY